MQRLVQCVALLTAFVAATFTIPASAQENARPSAEAPPLGQLDKTVVPERYTLDLTIVPARDRFEGAVTITVTLKDATDHIWLHGKDLDVTEARLITARGDNIRAEYTEVHESGVARLDLERLAPVGRARLSFQYTAPFSDGLSGLYKVTEQGAPYIFTQFEPISARRVFPGFDEPVFKVPFDITLTVPEEATAVTATPAMSTRSVADGLKEIRYAPTRPLPTYLLAFIVGEFDVVEGAAIPANDVRDRPLPLRGIAVKGKGEGLDYALDHTAEIVAALERYFGVPYPYEKLDLIAVPDFRAGAMENVGAITYREPRILLGSDASVEQVRSFMYTHAHELAHQWFGNLVTPEWWDDIWLNESFATWMGYRVLDRLYPDAQVDRDMLRSVMSAFGPDSLVHARRIQQPVTDQNGIANAFDAITYSKGGGVLSMFENYLGSDTFRAGIRAYIRQFTDGTATAEDFIAALAEAAGEPEVADAFQSFLTQSGLPQLSVDRACGAGESRLSLRQSRYLPLGSEGRRSRTWGLPVCTKLRQSGSWQQQCGLMPERRSEWRVTGQCPVAVMPNADGAGYYRWTLSDEGWDRLMQSFSTLTPREQIIAADSLSAAFRAGERDKESYMAAARRIARSPIWDVSTAPMDMFSMIAEYLTPEAEKSAFKQQLADIYSSKLTSLAPRTTSTVPRLSAATEARLRRRVVYFLAVVADHQPLRQELTKRAADYIGFNAAGGLHPDAINPDLLSTALHVGAQELGADFVDTLIARLKDATDSTLRARLVNAIAHVRDPAQVGKVRELALSDVLRDNEVETILWRQMGMPETRPAMWPWIQDNYAALRDRLTGRSARDLIQVTRNFCSAGKGRAVETFFKPRLAEIEGGERTLNITLERIQLCAALREQTVASPDDSEM